MSNTNTTGKKYFDLKTTGIGYLKRIREVKPKKGNPFLSCAVCALNGESDDVKFVWFDCNVPAKDAQHLVRKCEKAVSAGKKVLIGFVLGDLWTDTFKYDKGEKAGQKGFSLKARLLYIEWIRIDGKEYYKAERKPRADADDAKAPEHPEPEFPSSEDADESEAVTEIPFEPESEPGFDQADADSSFGA